MPPAPVLIVLIVYGAALLGIGLWGRRESRTVAGYFIAGKRLPGWVIAFSSNATGESAWLLLGLTGMAYAVGFHAFWVVLGEVLGVTLGWTLVARPMKDATDRYDSITVPDYLTSRFHDRSHAFRWLALIVVFTMVIAYTSAQLTAIGKAFGSFLGTTYTAGAAVGLLLILFYTTVGGFKAVAYTDLFQGLLMFAGLALLPFVGVAAAGGWESVTTNLRQQDPALLMPMGEAGLSAAGIVSVIGFVAVGLAFLGAPQLLVRWMAARDRTEIENGSLIAVICIIVFDVGAVLTGVAGRALFPGLADQEAILPTMTAGLLPGVFTGIFLVVVLAASMSTVDSLLILAASVIGRDIIQNIFNPAWTERRIAAIGQITTAIIGVVALAFALGEVRLVFWFVLFAWSGLACAFTPVVLCSLFWRRTTREGAIAGMIAGFVTAVVWVVAFKARTHDLYEMIPGFIAAFALTIGVSLLTEPDPAVMAEYQPVRLPDR